MPELPEVETIVRELCASHVVGSKIKNVIVFWPRTIAMPAVADLCSRLSNQVIVNISRRGKFIIFTLSEGTLLVHLRMTGKFTLANEKRMVTPHERVRMELGDGRFLYYEDQRKFGKWYLLSDPATRFHELGIEPLSNEFTLQTFQKLIKKSSQQIKSFLLNQRHIAGLGNIYVDEALWEAKVHPTRKANTLTQTEAKALHRAIPHVLKQGIAHMGTSLGSTRANYFSVSGRRGGNQTQLNVFRRETMPCPRCGCSIIKIKVAQRGTHLCPHCQK